MFGGFLVLCLVAAAAYYFMFGGKEKLERYLFDKKSLSEKVDTILAKDLSAEYARCAFYINNNYKKRMSQADWKEYCQKQVANISDKDSQEYVEAVAPILNAIVLDKEGYYMRRGMEDLSKNLERFRTGANDEISLNYFIQPYKYKKQKMSKKAEEFAANLTYTGSYLPDIYTETPEEYHCQPDIYTEPASTSTWDWKEEKERKERAKAERQERMRELDARHRVEREAFRQKMETQKQELRQDRATRAAGIAKCSNCANNRKCPSGIKESGAGLTCAGYTPK